MEHRSQRSNGQGSAGGWKWVQTSHWEVPFLPQRRSACLSLIVLCLRCLRFLLSGLSSWVGSRAVVFMVGELAGLICGAVRASFIGELIGDLRRDPLS